MKKIILSDNLKGNKMIAEFLGLVLVEEKYYKTGLPCFYYPCKEGHMQITDQDFEDENFDITIYAWTIYNLSYDSSWDDLMPVMRKISDMYYGKMVTEVTDEENNILKQLRSAREMMELNNAWYWTVEFLRYNENEKNNIKILYNIVDEKGRFFCSNDFNGKASFLDADENGNPPCTAYSKYKDEAERKIDYLMNHTSNPNNPGKKYFLNKFSELKLISNNENKK